MENIQNAKSAGLPRRLAAIFYDAWIVLAIWLIGSTLDAFLSDALGVDPATRSHLPLQLFILLSTFVFFGWFWTHGGQTIGMRAWRLQLLADDGSTVSWKQALKRWTYALLSLAPAGAGYLWVLFDRDGLAWHDRLSGTRLVIRKKK